jgi:hypothetical protein
VVNEKNIGWDEEDIVEAPFCFLRYWDAYAAKEVAIDVSKSAGLPV